MKFAIVRLALAAFLPVSLLAEETPNVVFILADDLGYGDVGCYGQKKILTPHIDSIARDGIKFTAHYSGQTVCTPSRASLMFGQHMGHCAYRNNGAKTPDTLDFMLPQLFKNAGYTTGMIGKWGLMGRSWDDAKWQAAHYPNNCGFDYWYGFESQGYAHFYYPERMLENKSFIQYPENVGIREEGLYAPGKGSHAHDLFIGKAEAFIHTHKDKPFFLYIPFAIPHAELAVPSDCKHLAYYKALGWSDKPRAEGGGGGGYGSSYPKGYSACTHPHATYAAMISRMDDSVGRIHALLEQLELDQDTLVIFSSDNGPSDEGGQTLEFFNSSGPFKGKKRSIYEAGTRVPFVAKWPARIQPGTSSSHPCGFNDIMATMADFIGQSAPATSDGTSFAPTLLGQPEHQAATKYRYYFWRDHEAIRQGDWKLITHKGEPAELYHLADDPGETTNLIKEHPEVTTRLRPLFKKAVAPLAN